MSALVGSGQFLLGVPVAIAAGAISFASPCVLPLVPGYLGYLGGADRARDRGTRRLALGAALFVLGFSAVYVLTAVVFSTVGILLLPWEDVLTRAAGVVVILLGVVFVGGMGPLQRIVKPGWRPRAGIAGAPLLGAVFAIGWSPCLGPTLGAIQSLSLTSGSMPTAALLAVAYSLGLGIPFVLLALGFGWATAATAFLRRHVRAVNLVGGGLLVAIGVLMVTGLWHAAVAWIGQGGGYLAPI